MKILLVEDESVIRKGVCNILREMSKDSYEIIEFDNAADALVYLQRNIPDLIITDIRMRDMDGLTMIGKVRQLYEDLPVIIITGYQDFEYAHQAIRYKVVDYLLKPINRLDLVSIVESIDKQRFPAAEQAEEVSAEPDLQESTPGEHRRIIRKLMEHIEASPDGDLRLQVLAEYVNMNATYLSQLFKNITGQNLSEYITKVRIERAKHLLQTTNLKIYDVAHLSGYQSPKHFMLVFKQHVGMTPGEYRDHCG